ncbi:MAG: DUF1080 domain-containing protein [Calditrichaeota bacterium]|nr:MAG: DUF1080 domain-containing protein [Calditrichota bacterium]
MKMIKYVHLLLPMLAFVQLPAAETAPQKLFNGRDLTNWQTTPFGPSGEVKVQNGVIILGMGDGATGITWQGEKLPVDNYEISLQACRLAGNDFFCGLTFPVHDSFLTLIIGGWGGSLIGLSCIDGYDASENETMRIKSFQNRQWYNIRLRLQNQMILAWIDGEKFVECNIDEREMSLRPEVLLSRPLGIASWYTKAGLKDIILTPIQTTP